MDVLFDESVREAPVSELHELAPCTYARFAGPDFDRGENACDVWHPPAAGVENGRFIGVVTRRDLLAYALRNPEPLTEPLLELIPALGEYA